MGCTQSKIENEEAVSRCKDRRDFMKKAVASRNEFAAAHTAYVMNLKNTGGALSDYGSGEVQDIHHQTHHHLHPLQPNHLQPTPQQPYEQLPPPPPPLPNFSPAQPLKRASTMPAFAIPKPDFKQSNPIQEDDEVGDDEEDDDDDDEDGNADHNLVHRRSRTTGGSLGGAGDRGLSTKQASTKPQPQPQPPSPPSRGPANDPVPPPPPESSTWDYFFPMVENIPGPSLSETDEIRPSDNDESDGGVHNNVNFKRSENTPSEINHVVESMGTMGGDSGDGGGGESNAEPQTPERAMEPEGMGKPVKKPKQMVHSNTAPQESRRVGKPGISVNLMQVLTELDEHFLKASQSAQDVSKMLEATRLHYHSNFADNRGHIDHSARVMRVITWNRSFRGMPNAGDVKDDFDAEEHETHATVLDKLLAWEKKLYDEVKAGELMKLEYQRKVALLNKQKKRSASTESLEKTKAAVSHLHTRYIVDMQSMDSTVSEINHLRDDQLYPKLVALVNGMSQMWHEMHGHHDSQLKLVIDLRSLDVSQAPKETSVDHHERTVQLWETVQEWHSQFQKLVNHQKEYIQALNSWLKLNLIPIESSLKEKVSSPPRVIHPPIQGLLYAWHEHLDKLPAELAGNAINSFAGIIKTILLHQEEEVKLKEKWEVTSKEYNRKNRQFEDWYHKYMQRRTPEEMDQDTTEDANHKDPVAERRFEVDSVKKRLEEEIEAHRKHCKQVREKSLSSLKTHLPELFRALSDFSYACSDMYKRLQSISHHHHQEPTESSS